MNGLIHSLLVATGATVAAGVLGLLAAMWCAVLRGRGRFVVRAASLVALALPSFLVTNCWINLLGANGLLHGWLPVNLYSLGGTVWILSLLLWPITFLFCLSAWQRIPAEVFESEPAMRGARLVRWLLLPAAGLALKWAGALTFVLALNNFAVPSILQVSVLTEEVWVRFNTDLNPVAALTAGWPLLAAPLVLLVLWKSRQFQWPAKNAASNPDLFRRQLGANWFFAATVVGVILLVLSVVVPLAQLLWNPHCWVQLFPALQAGGQAAFNSLLLSTAAALTTVAVSLFLLGVHPYSVWARKSGDKSHALQTLRELRGASSIAPAFGVRAIYRRFVADRTELTPLTPKSPLGCLFSSKHAKAWTPNGVILWLPFLAPGIFLGLGLIFLLNRPPLIAMYQSAATMFLGLVIRYLGPAWFGTAQAMRRVDTELIDAARLEGAMGWRLFKLAIWPQIASQTAACWYVVYLLCLWDVETLVLIQPPGGETLALRIFNLLHYGHHPQVDALCVWLLVLALLPLGIWAVGTRFKFVRAFAMALIAVLACSGCTPAASNSKTPVQSRFFESVEIIGSRGTGSGQFNKPRSVTVDREDNLYVVDMTGRVQKFSPNGDFLLSWQMPETDLGKAKGLGIDKDGNIIVVEPHYQRLNHFTPQGKLVAQWGVKGTNAAQFILPRAVAVSAQGNLYVSEYTQVDRVQCFAGGDKKYLFGWGQAGEGTGQFNRAEGLGIDGQGRIYVADSCNHRIQVFDAQGRFLRAFGKAGNGQGELSYPYDVRIDAARNEFVCEFGNSRIQVFDDQGRSIEILGGPGSEPGKFNNPWGIAFDSKGNLYVADALNHRVQKFTARNKRVAGNPNTECRIPKVVFGELLDGDGPLEQISLSRFADLRASWETVEIVSGAQDATHTPLKWGVNERGAIQILTALGCLCAASGFGLRSSFGIRNSVFGVS